MMIDEVWRCETMFVSIDRLSKACKDINGTHEWFSSYVSDVWIFEDQRKALINIKKKGSYPCVELGFRDKWECI